MDAITIDSLKKDLAENMQRQEVEQIILDTIEEMKHYQQVNKRFTDRLKEKGVWAWIYREPGREKLMARKDQNSIGDALETYRYNHKLTWELIKEELARYKLKENEALIRERMARHSQDIETLKEILAFLESKTTFNSFHHALGGWKTDLGYCIKNSQK